MRRREGTQPCAGTVSQSSRTYTGRAGVRMQSHHAVGVGHESGWSPILLLTPSAYGVKRSQWGARKIGGRGWQIATP